MKKLLVLLFVVVLFGGCGAEKNIPPLPDLNFSGSISATYNNFNMKCSIDNILADRCTVTVIEPEILSGFTVHFKNGVSTLSFKDVVYDIEPSLNQRVEFVSIFSESIKKVLVSSEYKKLENGNWLYTGVCDYGKFLLVQDSESGYPLSFRIPEAGLSITFSNMKPIQNNGG